MTSIFVAFLQHSNGIICLSFLCPNMKFTVTTLARKSGSWQVSMPGCLVRAGDSGKIATVPYKLRMTETSYLLRRCTGTLNGSILRKVS